MKRTVVWMSALCERYRERIVHGIFCVSLNDNANDGFYENITNKLKNVRRQIKTSVTNLSSFLPNCGSPGFISFSALSQTSTKPRPRLSLCDLVAQSAE